VPVNLGGLDDHIVSDTLFGHERGAFTGADKARKGLVRAAAGGTLFLDEFAELKPESQTKLLRLLDSGEFLPIGSDLAEQCKARIVMATNRDLDSEIATGRFRKDLYFRIAAHRVHVPPLRERPEDVEPILTHLMQTHSGRLGQPAIEPRDSFLHALNQAPLEGNVRELEQIVLSTLMEGKWPELVYGKTRSMAVDGRSPHTAVVVSAVPAPSDSDRQVLFGQTLPTPSEAVEELLKEADRRYPNNRSAAAAAIGLSAQAFANRWRRMADDNDPMVE
jgi:DNA-binding NtrC family response regulator